MEKREDWRKVPTFMMLFTFKEMFTLEPTFYKSHICKEFFIEFPKGTKMFCFQKTTSQTPSKDDTYSYRNAQMRNTRQRYLMLRFALCRFHWDFSSLACGCSSRGSCQSMSDRINLFLSAERAVCGHTIKRQKIEWNLLLLRVKVMNNLKYYWFQCE